MQECSRFRTVNVPTAEFEVDIPSPDSPHCRVSGFSERGRPRPLAALGDLTLKDSVLA